VRTDAGRGTHEGRRGRRSLFDRLIPLAKSGQAGALPVSASSHEPAGQSRRTEATESRGKEFDAPEGTRSLPRSRVGLHRWGYYGLALLLVGVAALLRWALPDVLRPVEFLPFGLAWVGAAVWGGMGPGLLTAVASWLCVELLFDSTPGHVAFGDPMSVTRLLAYLAGGLVVGVVGEGLRRARIRARRHAQELAAADRALRESEFHLAQAQQIAHLGSWSWDLAEGRLYWSDETYRLYGLQPGEAEPRHEDFLSFVHPEDRPRVQQGVQEALARGGAYQLDFRIVQRGGRERYVHCETQIILDQEGHPVKAEGALQDVTERRRAEQDLSESRDRYQALIETTADFIWEMDAEGKYTYCSPQMKALWGYEPEDMIGKTPFDRMPSEDREQALRAFMSLAKSPGPFTGLEASSYDSQGRLIAVEISGVPFFGVDGGLLGYRGISRDVTERKRAEETLRRSEAALRRSQEITRVHSWALNFETRELDVSDQAFRNYGYKVGEVKPTLALYLSHIHPDDKKMVLEYLEGMQRGELGSAEYRIVRLDGSLCVMYSVVDGLNRDPQGRVIGAYGIGQDVTERKRAEQALRELNTTLESRVARRTAQLQHRAGQLQKLTLELAEAEERERKRLAGILHDDLQQVLAAAKLHVGLLSGRVKNDAESHEIAEQAKGLLADAIAKSRSLSHELSAPGLSRSNLREPFEWLAGQIQQKHRFTVHLEMGERIEVASEPLRVLLYKAAQELLFNAIKHAGVHEAKLRMRRQRARLQLLVSDAGRGFEFGPSGPALGFGLLSIRERIEYLGGRLKIRSATGKGSTFLITVPDTEVHRGT
jgi:PAS domain S-box-containing protein